MRSTFAFQITAVFPQVSQQIASLHSTATISRPFGRKATQRVFSSIFQDEGYCVGEVS